MKSDQKAIRKRELRRTRLTAQDIPEEIHTMIMGLSYDAALGVRALVDHRLAILKGELPAARVLGDRPTKADPTLEAGDRAAQIPYNQRALFRILSRYVFDHDGKTPPPLGRFRHHKLLADTVATLERIMVRGFRRASRKIDRADRHMLYHLFAKIIGGVVARNRRSLSVERMLEYSAMFGAEMERQFPGYVASGLLAFVLDSSPHAVDAPPRAPEEAR